MHASTAAILTVGLVAGWSTFRVFVHALVLVAIVGEVSRLRSNAFRQGLARAVPVFRAEESSKPCGAFWLIVGYAAASWFPAPGPAAGILSAAVADPAASLVGSRWGGGKKKSLAGTAAALLVTAVLLFSIGVPLGTVLAGSTAAATLERVSSIDDNLIIAPGVAAVAWWFA